MEIYEILYNEINGFKIIKSIKYSDVYIKDSCIYFLGFLLIFSILTIGVYILYLVDAFPLFITYILCGCDVVPVLSYFVVKTQLKAFSLEFEDNKLTFKTTRKRVMISYSELKSCGTIRSAGSLGLKVFDVGWTDYTLEQGIFYFSSAEKPNFKKMIRQANTSLGIYHGTIKNDTCYLSAEQGNIVFRKCINAVDYYCRDYDVVIIDTNKYQIKKYGNFSPKL